MLLILFMMLMRVDPDKATPLECDHIAVFDYYRDNDLEVSWRCMILMDYVDGDLVAKGEVLIRKDKLPIHRFGRWEYRFRQKFKTDLYVVRGKTMQHTMGNFDLTSEVKRAKVYIERKENA